MSYFNDCEMERLAEEAEKYRDALVFVREWFHKLEDGTPADDPLREIRRRFHAPIHAKLDEALGTANASQGADPSPAGGTKK